VNPDRIHWTEVALVIVWLVMLAGAIALNPSR
jgi:hypothetical protein